jgi:hypothetical protein
VWTDWEWRAWGVAHRARAAVRRAWQSLVTHDRTSDIVGDDDDPASQGKPRAVDERHLPQP